MLSYLKQLILFILFFISFHFAYNYIKDLFSNKKKEFEDVQPSKYNSVLNEINELLEKRNNDDPKVDSSFNKNEPENIETQSLEEELANYMKEMEQNVLLKTTENKHKDRLDELKTTTSFIIEPSELT